MSFYINKKLKYNKIGFLDTIQENIKYDQFPLINDNSFLSNNKFNIKKSKTCQDLIKECHDKENKFSGNVEDLPDSVFLAIGEYLYIESNKKLK